MPSPKLHRHQMVTGPRPIRAKPSIMPARRALALPPTQSKLDAAAARTRTPVGQHGRPAVGRTAASWSGGSYDGPARRPSSPPSSRPWLQKPGSLSLSLSLSPPPAKPPPSWPRPRTAKPPATPASPSSCSARPSPARPTALPVGPNPRTQPPWPPPSCTGCRFSTLMSPEAALTCGPAGVLSDLSAGFFSPVCHFLRWPAARLWRAAVGGVQHGAQLGPGDPGSSQRTRHRPCDTARQPIGRVLMPGWRSRDAVTDPAPGNTATPVTFSRTCRKRDI